MNDLCSRKGIKREFSNAKTPQQNGVAKRRNRTLIEAARTMVLESLRQKGGEGCFIGYSMSSKAFRVFNKRTKRVKENLYIDFLKNKHIEKGAGPNWLFDIDSLTNSINYVPVVVAGTHSTNFSGTKKVAGQDVKKDVSSLRYISLPNWFHEAHLKSATSNAQDACNADAPESSGNFNPTTTSPNPLADHMETLAVETPIPIVSSPVSTACLNDSSKLSSDTRLISKRVTSQNDTPSLDNILTLTNRFEDILGVTTNTNDSNEVEADLGNMEYNISASPTLTFKIHKDHPKSQIIGPVDTPVQTITKVRPIGTKWVLKNKKVERGIVIRNKARLVAQEHKQKEGIDYDEIFAPVARIKAIKLFLAYASFIGFTVYQMDVKSAFLYGTIDEDVYVMQPPGFQDPEFPTRVYKVEKAMYGLHQDPRAWYDERGIVIRNEARLVARGYTQEEGIDYHEVFAPVARIEAIRLFLAYTSFKDFVVYQMDVKSAFLYGQIEEEVTNKVNVVSSTVNAASNEVNAVGRKSSIKLPDDPNMPKLEDISIFEDSNEDVFGVETDLNNLESTFQVRLQVKQKENGIFISQDKYAAKILKKFGFSKVKTSSTPMETQKPLLKDEDGEEVDVHIYRSMIGSLMYLTSSRLDIMFAVFACARYQVNPKVSHLHAVKKIFRYLKGQPKLGLWYPKDYSFDLMSYTDSDYAGASLNRKSTTRGCQFLWCRLISWQKQTVVANFTTEAEYVAASSCCAYVLWI
nr:hypothetical protein [Tanacetum cinerariifolium]